MPVEKKKSEESRPWRSCRTCNDTRKHLCKIQSGDYQKQLANYEKARVGMAEYAQKVEANAKKLGSYQCPGHWPYPVKY